jgi:hypothetical protein
VAQYRGVSTQQENKFGKGLDGGVDVNSLVGDLVLLRSQ